MRKWINISEGIINQYTDNDPLFHGTDFLSLALILQSDYMSPSIDTDHDQITRGVSLTNNISSAWSFASRACSIFDDNNHMLNIGDCPSGGLLCFNTEKIRASYQLVNYVDHLTFGDNDDIGDEDEVRVITPTRLQPISSYLEWFTFHDNSEEWFIRYLEIPNVAREYNNVDKIIEYIRNIKHHPKFRK